jgi:enoyl-CoA hydratase/carnithine racemase
MAISKAIQAVNLSDTDKGFETEIKYFGELFEMDDKKEGVSAFLEKESQLLIFLILIQIISKKLMLRYE